MSSEQERYHAGVDHIVARLANHARHVGFSRRVLEEEERQLAAVTEGIGSLLGAVGAALDHYDSLVTPRVENAHDKARTVEQEFEGAFPDTAEKLVLQAIAGGIASLVRNSKEIVDQTAALKENVREVGALTETVAHNNIEPLASEAAVLPDRCDEVLEFNNALVAQLNAQRGRT